MFARFAYIANSLTRDSWHHCITSVERNFDPETYAVCQSRCALTNANLDLLSACLDSLSAMLVLHACYSSERHSIISLRLSEIGLILSLNLREGMMRLFEE